MRRCYICILLMMKLMFLHAQSVPIGSWQEHLPWRYGGQLITTERNIICAARYGFFTLNPADNTIRRFHKINGLNGTDITAIGFSADDEKLIVAYADAGIDLLSGNTTTYIPDIKRANLQSDKRIRNIFTRQGKALLSMGFGIVVLNLSKNEIEDTWYIGSNGAPLRINHVGMYSNSYYAATEAGLYRAPVTGVNLADFTNWEKITTVLPDTAFAETGVLGNELLARTGNSIYRLSNGNWTLWYSSTENLTGIFVENNQPVLLEKNGRIVFLNQDGNSTRTYADATRIPEPEAIRWKENAWWVSDAQKGLIRLTPNFETQLFTPAGPQGIVEGTLYTDAVSVSAAAGTVLPDGSAALNRNGIFVLQNDEWKNYSGFSDSISDLNCILKDRTNGYIYAGSLGGGLIEVAAGGQINVFKQNTGLSPALNTGNPYRIRGLSFDRNNNLWIANDGAQNNIVVRRRDKSWLSFPIPFSHQGRSVSQLLEDESGQQWIVSPGGNGLFCFNYGNSLDNPADDRWRYFRSGKGNGNLPDNTVNCIAKDKNGFIWIGTNKGIGVMQCTGQVFGTQPCEVTLPIVQQDNFAGYLFQNEIVQSIAIDGGNRKWIGTHNGVWLINPEGDKVITRFTSENSPLLNNDVRHIAIGPADGVIYFATSAGLCSFRGTATEAAESGFSVKIFPNPVPPEFTGTIAIRELPRDAYVKITEADGRLVYQTRANGGQAIWNGKDYLGRKVASGVYLVLVTDETRKENLAGRIVITR